jgi:hypothetical protein
MSESQTNKEQANKLDNLIKHTSTLEKSIWKLQSVIKLEQFETGKLHLSNADENHHLTITDKDVQAGLLNYLRIFYENKVDKALKEIKEL